MDALPNEILFEIFERLDYRSLKCLQRVCRHFSYLLATNSRTSGKIDKILFRSSPIPQPIPTTLRGASKTDDTSSTQVLGMVFNFHPVFAAIQYKCTEYIEHIEIMQPLSEILKDPKIRTQWQGLIDIPAAMENACEPAVARAVIVVDGPPGKTSRTIRGYGPKGAVTVMDVMVAFAFQAKEMRIERKEPLGLWRIMYHWGGLRTKTKAERGVLRIPVSLKRDLDICVYDRTAVELVTDGTIPKRFL